VIIDQKRKYILKVSHAIHQGMPIENRPSIEPKLETRLEDTDDFLFFTRNVLNAEKQNLLPLELQISIKRDQEAALKEQLAVENTLNSED